MKVTKPFLRDVLSETIDTYEQKVVSIPASIKLVFQDKNEFLERAKEQYLVKLQLGQGWIRSLKIEYPECVVSYPEDRYEKGREVCNITVCLEIAKERMKSYSTEEAAAYFRYVFVYVISRMVEGILQEVFPNMWREAWDASNGNLEVSFGWMAETWAERIAGTKESKRVCEELWRPVMRRIEKHKKEQLM